MEKFSVTTDAYEICEKKVGKTGNSGRIYVPVSWIGKKAKAILLEPVEEEEGD